jgi:intein-encoded DNA endonuclease-like protein
MSNKASIADNQQGSPETQVKDPSETIRRAPCSVKEIKAYFLGAIHDGTFSGNRRFRISQKGTDWLEILKELLKKIGYNSWIYKEGSTRDVCVLETLANFLDFQFNPLGLKETQEKIAYVRGFFDAEGGIPRNPEARFYIQLVQNDKPKLAKVKKILNDLGIKTGKIHNPSNRIDPFYWRMYVLAGSHREFISKINSWHPRKIKALSQRFAKQG